jgi:DNA polymerase-1
LITQFGSLSNLIKQADTIKQKKRRESLIENAEKVLLFRKIVTLDEFIPVSKMTLPSSFQDVSAFRMSPFDSNKLIGFYKRMELSSCQNQLESRLRSSLNNFKPPPSPEEYQGVPF